MADKGKDPRIEDRRSWLFVGVVGLFALVIAYKVFATPIPTSVFQITFSELLSLLLALFAIAISVAFYFKATDTSNQFYDNTYKFTTEVSEILGRIEAGFGERLKHLDEGYAGIRAKVERIPVMDAAKAEQAVRKEEEEVEKAERERQQLLEELAARAQLEDHEKEQLFQQLHAKEDELARARDELQFLRTRLKRSERAAQANESGFPPHMVHYASQWAVPALGGRAQLSSLSCSGVQQLFDSAKRQLSRGFIKDLTRHGLADEQGHLNEEGVVFLQHLALNTVES
jgi:hypothetical protein